jgi:acetyl-CoA synthase
MSRYIATRAIRGANAIVNEAEVLLEKAIKEKGADTPVSFPNTAYYLPFILGMTSPKKSSWPFALYMVSSQSHWRD